MATLRKIKDVAQLLGASDQTVRLWATEFRAFMSPTAAPASGVAREFNDVDIRLLTIVRDLRRQQRPVDEIQTALRQAVDTGDLPPMPEPPPSESEKTAYLASVRDQWLTERTTLQRDISRLEADNDALRQQLAAAQDGRRTDVERLSREAERERALRELYESGRLKPPGE